MTKETLTEQPPDTTGWVKKETLLLAIFLALVAGFIAGVVFGVYKSAKVMPIAGSGDGMPGVSPPAVTEELKARIAAHEKQVADHPDDPEGWTHLGNLYFDSEQIPKAIEAYEKALALAPQNADVWTDLGVMYRRDGKPQEAAAAFDRAMATDPKHEIARFNKGVVLLHDLNDREGALKVWDELITLNPDARTPSGKTVRELLQQLRGQDAAKP